MQRIRRLLLRIGSTLPLQPKRGVRFLLFHEIEEQQRSVFESLINFINERYGFISPDDYDSAVSQDGVRYIVSFDDGFRSQQTAVRNVLDPLGIKALFFICPGFVGAKDEEIQRFLNFNMKRDDLRAVTPDFYPISRKELSLLAHDGHVIGSHGLTHTRMTELNDPDVLVREIKCSKKMIESISGRRTEWFAYPYGDITSINPSSLEIIGRNYRYCCSGVRGINTGSVNRLCMRRENVNFDATLDKICQIAEGGFDFLYFFRRKTLDAMVSTKNNMHLL